MSRSRAVATGAIAAFALLAYLVFAKELPFSGGYRIEAVVQSSNELREGAPVRIAGVTVGEVAGFEPGPGATRVVVLELEERARPVRRDATGAIRPRLFLEGGFYVQLEPGSPSAPELEAGGTIPLAQTSVPVGLDEVFSALRHDTRAGGRRVLRELDRALGDAEGLRDTPRRLAPALRDLALLAEAARGDRPGDLSGIVRSGSRVTAALASRERELSALVHHLSTAAGALASEDDALAASIRELDGLAREAPAQLELVDRALPSVTRLAAALRPGLRAAPPVLADAAPLLGELEALARPAELPRLLDLAAPTLRRLPSLEARLTALFPRVTEVTDCVRERMLPVLEAELDDGRLSTGRPVWQELVQALASSASASQAFDGNGPWLRLHGLGGEQSVSLGSDLPGAEELIGLVSEPIVGTRPRPLPPGAHPPLRPDAECRRQEPTDLRADRGPPPEQGEAERASADPSRLLRALGMDR